MSATEERPASLLRNGRVFDASMCSAPPAATESFCVRHARLRSLGAEDMNAKRYAKLVHEGEYVAEVDVELFYTEEGWSPYLSLDDAYKLDDVREALRRGDVKSASRLAKVYTLTPVSV